MATADAETPMDARQWTGDPEEQHDPNQGRPVPYVCTACAWTGQGGVTAYAHHQDTGHAVRGRRWPAAWPDAVFSCCERAAARRAR